MKLVKKLSAIFLLFSFIFANAYATASNTVAPNPVDKNKSASFLFIQTAEKGNLKKNSDNETYTLTLSGIEGWVTYFSTSAHRVTGIMSIPDFNKLMERETQTHVKGLNTGLVAVQDNQKVRYMISLSKPAYDAKKDVATFEARVVPGDHKYPVPDQAEFDHVSLFIDSVCFLCGGKGI